MRLLGGRPSGPQRSPTRSRRVLTDRIGRGQCAVPSRTAAFERDAFLSWAERQKIQPQLHLDPRQDLFAFKRGDALLEELAVQFESDGGDVAALLRAEEIAGSTDFQVAHGNFEPAAEGGVLLDGAEAFANVREQSGVAWKEEVSIGLVFVTAHPAAQL